MSTIYFKNALLVTMNAKREILRGEILVEDDRIAGIFLGDEGVGSLPQNAGSVRVVDASDMMILPGFVQAHIHLCQTLFRNRAEDLPLLDWLRLRIWPFEAAHDEASMRVSARLGIAELLAGGTTAILDMGTVRHYDMVFDEARTMGIRMAGGKCMMDVQEGLPSGLRETTKESLRESLRLQKEWHNAADGRLRYAYAPRFSLSCSEHLLREVAEVAAHQGCLIHTHAGETAAEEEIILRRHGMRSFAFLRSVGIFGSRCCLAHGVQANAIECGALATDGTRIAHCPSSNMKLGSGLAPIVEMRRAGIRVGLGADGAPCNNNLDVFREMLLAGLIQSSRNGAGALSAQSIVEMATIEGAECLGWDDEIGSLEVGKKADLVVVRLQALHGSPLNPEGIYSHIVYSSQCSDVYLTMVDGKVCFENGQFAALEAGLLKAKLPEEKPLEGLLKAKLLKAQPLEGQITHQADEELHKLLRRIDK